MLLAQNICLCTIYSTCYKTFYDRNARDQKKKKTTTTKKKDDSDILLSQQGTICCKCIVFFLLRPWQTFFCLRQYFIINKRKSQNYIQFSQVLLQFKIGIQWMSSKCSIFVPASKSKHFIFMIHFIKYRNYTLKKRFVLQLLYLHNCQEISH